MCMPGFVVFDVLRHRSKHFAECLNILLGLELEINEKDECLQAWAHSGYEARHVAFLLPGKLRIGILYVIRKLLMSKSEHLVLTQWRHEPGLPLDHSQVRAQGTRRNRLSEVNDAQDQEDSTGQGGV